MKNKLVGLFLIGLLVCSFTKDKTNIKPLASVEGLSLYMDHEVFSENGRELRFVFYETKQYETRFKLIFEYEIIKNDIVISLVDKIDTQKNKKIIVINDFGHLNTPTGTLCIPDNLLFRDNYSLILKTSDHVIKSELVVSNEKIVLNIPTNNYFSCRINKVYPIPKNLLFGSIIFSGKENIKYANDFFAQLEAIGFIKTKVPNYPYRHLTVDRSGIPKDENWSPDYHNLRFLYKMDGNFKKAVDLAKEKFEKFNWDIYLYSSNGDQAVLNKISGITVDYAD